jgi:hypothetical protein
MDCRFHSFRLAVTRPAYKQDYARRLGHTVDYRLNPGFEPL